MEQNQIRDKLKANKEKMLQWHNDFFTTLKKIQSYEDLTKDLILNSDSFMTSDNKPDINQLMMFIVKTKMEKSVNDIFGLKE